MPSSPTAPGGPTQRPPWRRRRRSGSPSSSSLPRGFEPGHQQGRPTPGGFRGDRDGPQHDPKVLVEAAVEGREVECAVLQGHGTEPPRTSEVAEIRVVAGSGHEFYDFDAKYLADSDVELVCPADIPPEVATEVGRLAAEAFVALGCEGLARVDCFYGSDGRVILNEINTMPGFTPQSMYPRMWAQTGLGYTELIEELVSLALQRRYRPALRVLGSRAAMTGLGEAGGGGTERRQQQRLGGVPIGHEDLDGGRASVGREPGAVRERFDHPVDAVDGDAVQCRGPRRVHPAPRDDRRVTPGPDRWGGDPHLGGRQARRRLLASWRSRQCRPGPRHWRAPSPRRPGRTRRAAMPPRGRKRPHGILFGPAAADGTASRRSDVDHGAGESASDPRDILDPGDHELAQLVYRARLHTSDDVVRTGDVLGRHDPGQLADGLGDRRGLADLGLDEDEGLDHVLPRLTGEWRGSAGVAPGIGPGARETLPCPSGFVPVEGVPVQRSGSGEATLADLSEDALLAQIFPLLEGGPVAGLGPGDDAAVVAAPDGSVVATTDAMVRGRDWRDEWSSGEDVGVKAVAQNLADLAAMGARPTGLLVTLVADPATAVAWVLAFARGLGEAARAAQTPVIGGDLSSAPAGTLLACVTALGSLDGRSPVLRSGARPGHVVAVAGTLGLAAAGWALLEAGNAAAHPQAVACQLRPTPRSGLARQRRRPEPAPCSTCPTGCCATPPDWPGPAGCA